MRIAFRLALVVVVAVLAVGVDGQTAPVVSATKATDVNGVRLSWTGGSAPFSVLRRTNPDPSLDPGEAVQDLYVLTAVDDVDALDEEEIYFYEVTAAASADTATPTIAITAPADGTSISTSTPTLTVTYSDPGTSPSGLDLSSFSAPINDVERANDFTLSETGASYAVSSSAPLEDGLHTFSAIIKDRVGNTAVTTPVTFSVNGPMVSSVAPVNGTVGTAVTINGAGFSPSAANNVVTFDGVAATVTTASSTSLSVTVPTGALTGNLKVTVGSLASNEKPFTVDAIGGFNRINNIKYLPTGDLVVVDRMADRVFCIPSGTTTKNVLDALTGRPVGLGITDTQKLFYSSSSTSTGPIYTLNGCNAGRTLFRNVQNSSLWPGISFALAHRVGTLAGEDQVYIAYRETQNIGTKNVVFRMPHFGYREQLPDGSYAFPAALQVVTGMEFDAANNLYVSVGGNNTIYYVPNGATSASQVKAISTGTGSQPAGMVFDDRGGLYVALQGTGKIIRIHPSFTGSGGAFDGTTREIASGYVTGLEGVRALDFRRVNGRGVLTVADAKRIWYLPVDDVTVTQVHFSHGGTGKAVDIRHNAATDVLTPEWLLSGARNEPVVYVEGQSIKVKATFSAGANVTSARIRATASHAGFALAPVDVTFTGGTSGEITFDGVTTVPTIAPTSLGLQLTWKASNINGATTPEFDINKSGRHPVYVVYGDPSTMFPNATSPQEVWFDGVLQQAVRHARGASSQSQAMINIVKNVYESKKFRYNPKARGFSLNVYPLTDILGGTIIDCVGMSRYVILLARSIGIPNSKVGAKVCGDPFGWTGGSSNRFTTSEVRAAYRRQSESTCKSEDFFFHQFPYDYADGTVYEASFKVGCSNLGMEGFIAAGMAFDNGTSADYKSYLNPTDTWVMGNGNCTGHGNSDPVGTIK